MSQTEQKLHEGIDNLQNREKDDEDRNAVLSYLERSEEIDRLQELVVSFKENNSVVRQDLREEYLRDLLNYLSETDLKILKEYFNTEISWFLARAKFLKTLDNSKVRELMDDRRKEQNKNYEEEEKNDDEDGIQKDVREKINGIEKEFGIDIRWATDILSLDWAMVLQENLRAIKSMPEFKDILEIVPYIKLTKEEGDTAWLSPYDFHWEFNLLDKNCFTFECMVHELTHVKDNIYRIANPDYEKVKIKEASIDSTEQKNVQEKAPIMTKQEFLNILDLDKENESDEKILVFLNSLPEQELQIIIEYLAFYDRMTLMWPMWFIIWWRAKNTDFIKENVPIMKSFLLTLSSFHNFSISKINNILSLKAVQESWINLQEIAKSKIEVNSLWIPRIPELMKQKFDLEQLMKLSKQLEGINIDDIFIKISPEDGEKIVKVLITFSGELEIDDNMKYIISNYSNNPKNSFNILCKYISQRIGLNLMFESIDDQILILQSPDLFSHFKNYVTLSKKNIYIEEFLWINSNKSKSSLGGKEDAVDDYWYNFKYFSEEEKEEARQYFLWKGKIKDKIPKEYKRSIELKPEEKYLKQWITRPYAEREYPWSFNKLLQWIKNSKSLIQYFVIYPELSVSFKNDVETLLATIKGREISKDRIVNKSPQEFLEELETILTNPNTSFEKVSKIIFSPQEMESLKVLWRELKSQFPQTEKMTNEDYEVAMNTLLEKRKTIIQIEKMFGIPISEYAKSKIKGMEMHNFYKKIIVFLIDFAITPEKCTIARVQNITEKLYILGKDVWWRDWANLEYPTTIAETWYYVKDGKIIIRPDMKQAYQNEDYEMLIAGNPNLNIPWIDELIRRWYIRRIN